MGWDHDMGLSENSVPVYPVDYHFLYKKTPIWEDISFSVQTHAYEGDGIVPDHGTILADVE